MYEDRKGQRVWGLGVCGTSEWLVAQTSKVDQCLSTESRTCATQKGDGAAIWTASSKPACEFRSVPLSFWVPVKELIKISYYNKATLILTMYLYYGNLI